MLGPKFSTQSFFVPTRLWRWNRQCFPKRWHIKFGRHRIAQKKPYNIQKTAKVWNRESYVYIGRQSPQFHRNLPPLTSVGTSLLWYLSTKLHCVTYKQHSNIVAAVINQTSQSTEGLSRNTAEQYVTMKQGWQQCRKLRLNLFLLSTDRHCLTAF